MLKILLPLDGSALAERAIAHTLALASGTDAKVTILRIVVPEEFRNEDAFSRVEWRLRCQQAGVYLQGIATTFEVAGIPYELRVEEGYPAECIMTIAQELGINLLVMSTHGHGAATDFPRGGVASKVQSRFVESICLVGPNSMPLRDPRTLYRRVLVPFDDSHESECALRVAISLSKSQGSQLTVVFVSEILSIPSVLSKNGAARNLCRELAEMTRLATQQKLVELKARIPQELNPHTAVMLAERSSNPIVEIACRYKPDLLVMSRTMTSGDRDPYVSTTQVASVVDHVPVLSLSPQEIGDAFCVPTTYGPSEILASNAT